MALLIVDLDKHIGNATAWRDTFAAQLPDLEIRTWPDAGNLADIEYLAFMHPDFDALPQFSEFESHVQPLPPGSSPLSGIQSCRRPRCAKSSRQAAIR